MSTPLLGPASIFCACQAQHIPWNLQKRQVRLDVYLVGRAIHNQSHGGFILLCCDPFFCRLRPGAAHDNLSVLRADVYPLC